MNNFDSVLQLSIGKLCSSNSVWQTDTLHYPAVRTGSSNTHFYYPAVRTGSSNTHFFSVVFFFGGHLPQTSRFRSAKQILVVSFATQARAFILSDRSIFYPPGGGEKNGGV